jgi:hypothetical protein
MTDTPTGQSLVKCVGPCGLWFDPRKEGDWKRRICGDCCRLVPPPEAIA